MKMKKLKIVTKAAPIQACLLGCAIQVASAESSEGTVLLPPHSRRSTAKANTMLRLNPIGHSWYSLKKLVANKETNKPPNAPPIELNKYLSGTVTVAPSK